MSQKCFEEKHVDLSLRGEENKKQNSKILIHLYI